MTDELIDGGEGTNEELDEGVGIGGGGGGKIGVSRGQCIKHPIRSDSDREDRINKIEQLTTYLHVKRFTEEISILEFFIPKKFKLQEHDESSDIFKELIDIKYVWFSGKYGDLNGFNIQKYHKKLDIVIEVDDKWDNEKKVDEGYIVLKFYAERMENIKRH